MIKNSLSYRVSRLFCSFPTLLSHLVRGAALVASPLVVGVWLSLLLSYCRIGGQTACDDGLVLVVGVPGCARCRYRRGSASVSCQIIGGCCANGVPISSGLRTSRGCLDYATVTGLTAAAGRVWSFICSPAAQSFGWRCGCIGGGLALFNGLRCVTF